MSSRQSRTSPTFASSGRDSLHKFFLLDLSRCLFTLSVLSPALVLPDFGPDHGSKSFFVPFVSVFNPILGPLPLLLNLLPSVSPVCQRGTDPSRVLSRHLNHWSFPISSLTPLCPISFDLCLSSLVSPSLVTVPDALQNGPNPFVLTRLFPLWVRTSSLASISYYTRLKTSSQGVPQRPLP